MTEYNNSTVGSACQYATLSHYNSNESALNVPVLNRTKGTHGYVVPRFGLGLGYNALTHGQSVGNCSGHFTITNAYGQNAQNCNTKYTRTLCNSSYQ